MSTPKHTPGPWHVGLKPGPMVYGPQGEQIVGINVMLDRDEVLANAKFIAAAPAMYAVLKEAFYALSYHMPDKFDDEEQECAWYQRMLKIEQVLAQAENKP